MRCVTTFDPRFLVVWATGVVVAVAGGHQQSPVHSRGHGTHSRWFEQITNASGAESRRNMKEEIAAVRDASLT